jgi:SAM-dependent methyltransferase
MATSERRDSRCGYFMRVFGEQWTAPGRTPSMLDLSGDGSLMSPAFARLGFEVTRIGLGDGSLEEVGDRLERLAGRFDVICCYDVLEQLDDWQNVLGRLARRLRSGGLFLYSVQARPSRTPRWLRAARRWLRGASGTSHSLRGDVSPTAGELNGGLRAARLLPREAVTLSGDGRWWARPATAPAGAASFAGYAVRETDAPARVAPATAVPLAAAPMRWDFNGTGERWLAGQHAGASLVARLGAR